MSHDASLLGLMKFQMPSRVVTTGRVLWKAISLSIDAAVKEEDIYRKEVAGLSQHSSLSQRCWSSVKLHLPAVLAPTTYVLLSNIRSLSVELDCCHRRYRSVRTVVVLRDKTTR